MALKLGLVLVIFSMITVCLNGQHNNPNAAAYSGEPTHPLYSCLITLSSPGEGCDLHPAYPKTIQCAETRRCIAKTQYKDGSCDCCGPDVDCATCYDHSDENRVEPPGDPQYCSDHEHFKLGVTFQCATRPEICLSRLKEWNNARCDCCPEVDGDCCHVNCTDHSDEECMANEWDQKFTCDGNCISLDKFSDNVPDCSYHCVENNKVARQACEVSRRQHDQLAVETHCDELRRANIPFFRCPSGTQKCILYENILDGKPDCEHGEDEDTTRHPYCDDKTKSSQCTAGTYECVVVEKEQYYCRCKKGQATSCNKNP